MVKGKFSTGGVHPGVSKQPAMRTIILLLVTVGLTAAKAAAISDPYAEMSTLRLAFAHLRSVVAVEHFSSGQTATVEFASPNRFHITMTRSEILLTGNIEYAKRAGGVWKRSGSGAQHQALLSAARYPAGPTGIDIHKLFTITPLGMKKLDRELVRRCLLHDTSGAYDEIVWIGRNYLPIAVAIEMPDQTLKIHYVAYNTSIVIAMPYNGMGGASSVSMRH
jgi:hypothetical protein